MYLHELRSDLEAYTKEDMQNNKFIFLEQQKIAIKLSKALDLSKDQCNRYNIDRNEALKKATKVTPVLLLDDIFDKLDDQRMAILLQMVCDKNFGQIFITDARPERTRTMLADNQLTARIFTVNDGVIDEVVDYEHQ